MDHVQFKENTKAKKYGTTLIDEYGFITPLFFTKSVWKKIIAIIEKQINSQQNSTFNCFLKIKKKGKINIAPTKKGFKNKYIINGDTTTIFIDKKNHGTLEFIIDTEDLKRLIDIDLSWYAVYTPNNDSYYAQASKYLYRENGKSVYEYYNLHTFIMNADASKGEKIDHINHDTFNTKKNNLRMSVNLENTRNRKSKNSNNKSGYRNVSLRDDKWWVVQLQINGKNTTLKKFPINQLEEAGIYAELMRQQYYGEFAGDT